MNRLLQFWRRHFLWVEFALAVMIGVTAAYWIHYRNGAVVSDRLLAQNRAAVYGTLASIFGSLLGFVITAASIVLGFSGSESLAVVRGSKHYPTLWPVFTASIRALAFATVTSVVASSLIAMASRTEQFYAFFCSLSYWLRFGFHDAFG